MVATSAEVMGVLGLCKDVGMNMQGEILADSSAALGISNRTGMGKVRHLRIQALWVQEVRSTGRLSYKKVLGTLNPSDILTKHVPGDLLDAHLKTLGMELRGGRAEAAPSLDELEIEYVTDWVERIPKKGVSFMNTVNVRPIPATGLGRPTRNCRKTRRAWADEEEDEGEGEVHSLVDEHDDGNDNDDQCEWEEIYGKRIRGPNEYIDKFETRNDYFGNEQENARMRIHERDLKKKRAVPNGTIKLSKS